MNAERFSGTRRSTPTKMRLVGLGLLILGIFLILLGNLFFLQVIRGLEYKRRAKEVARRVVPIPAQRGEIFDRHFDFPLVVNQDSFAVNLVPAEVEEAGRPSLFQRIAGVLKLTPQEIENRVPLKYSHLFQPVEIKGGVAFETIAYLAEHLEDFQGINWHNKPIRNYLHSGSLAHVIGYVGDITREEIQVLYNRGYGFGAVLGKSGIEKQYDELLRGQDGKRFQVVDVREKHLSQQQEEEIPPQPGKTLVLTIDRHIQQLSEKALGKRIGSVLVLKAGSGEILALVSYPNYDPNIFLTDRAAELFNQLSLDPDSPFMNRTMRSAYPPASTFKVVMSTAVVEEEVFPLTRTVTCNGKIRYGDRDFYCWQRKTGHGPVDLFSGLAQSCDVYFYTLGEALGPERIAYYAREFGLGQVTGVDLPGEAAGFVPTPEWKEKALHVKWLGGDTLNFSIGQGYLLASPLQMANVAAMVANAGKVYRPYLLKEIRDPITGEIVRRTEPELIHTSHIRRDTFRTIQQAMRGTISEGTAEVVITTKAVEVAGKTGTAEVGLEDRWHSWFVAYAPYQTEDPQTRVVVVVMVEAENEWEWWAPKAANVILQGIFADQTYEEAVETLQPWWYRQLQQQQRTEEQQERVPDETVAAGRARVPGAAAAAEEVP